MGGWGNQGEVAGGTRGSHCLEPALKNNIKNPYERSSVREIRKRTSYWDGSSNGKACVY